MTTFVFANNVNTALAGGISSTSTTLTVNSTLNLPTSIPAGSVMALSLNDAATKTKYEIVYVTAISGATLTVVRGQEGTAAQTWITGDLVFSGPTAGQMQNFQQESSTGVSPGTYGSSTQVPQFTVNAQGQITAVSNVAIAFPITSFNGRAGAIVLNSGDVTTALGFTPVANTTTVTANNGLTGGGALSANITIGLAAIAATTLLANPTGASAVPQAATLANGLQFSGTSLGLGAISPSSISTGAGTFTGAVTFGGIVQSSTTTCILAATGAGEIYLRPNGSASTTGQMTVDTGGNLVVTSSITAAAGGFFCPAGGYNVGSGAAYIYETSGGTGVLGFRTGATTGAAKYFNMDASGNLNVLNGGITTAGFATIGGGISSTVSSAENDISINYGGSANYGWYIAVTSAAMTFNVRSSTGAFQAQALSLSTSNYGVTVNYNLTVVGTANVNASDERLKTIHARNVAPVSIHDKLGLIDYTFNHTGDRAIGLSAQDVAAQPELSSYVSEFDYQPDGAPLSESVKRLKIDKAGLALSAALWAGHELDRLRAEIAELRRAVFPLER